MKIKLIALAVAALVSGAAQADIIDQGQASGNGTVLFAIWDAASSFAVNTKVTMDGLSSLVGNGGVGFSYTSSGLSNWLSTADAATVTWTVFANDQFGLQYRSLTTSDGLNEGTASNSSARGAASVRSGFIQEFLNGGAFADAGVTESTALFGTAAYIGESTLAGGLYNFGSTGTLANSDYTTGMQVISVNTANNLNTGRSAYVTVGTPVAARAYMAGNTFNIGAVAAVPEADSLAMLLAGMGLVGTIARRRNRKTA